MRAHQRSRRRAGRAVPADELKLFGLGLHGPRGVVDKVTKGSGCTAEPGGVKGGRRSRAGTAYRFLRYAVPSGDRSSQPPSTR
ncbi:DUF2000 family protein [Streptomyces sp. NPDC001070]